MTQPHPLSPPRRRWPWSRRTPTFADVSIALFLLVVDAMVIWATVLGYGMRGWAAQGDRQEIDTVALAEMAWLRNLAVVLTVGAGIALLCRARWTVASLVLAGLVVGAFHTQVQREYDTDHPSPAPASRHVPCYSGSGTCE
ncbi:DUF6234 family protein [Streptomyces sp. NPDC005435]|uniref:DUF6234 family protein n=1 Tax=Streptomyces sp. NPDC005435 TaxID=3154464 RepID=UPI00345120DC